MTPERPNQQIALVNQLLSVTSDPTGIQTLQQAKELISTRLAEAAETRACARLGVTTVVAVVSGAKGYAYDSTHKTFVTQARQNGLSECEGFVLDKAEYFPIDAEAVGNWFVFHELHLVYRRKP
jgi:hypothetical protein